MLRITTERAGSELVMKLEGCLEGASVPEVEAVWREAAMSHNRPVRVDLVDVCHVDERGRVLMTEMFRAGVRFTARGCEMPELVREISETVRT